MDTMMWVIVAAVLSLAIGMAVVAWRLLRNDRERTAARAAMLRQLAFEPEPALNERAFQAPIAASYEPSFGAMVDRTPPPTRRLMAVAVVAVFMAIGAGSVYGIYKPSPSDDGLSRRSSEGAKADSSEGAEAEAGGTGGTVNVRSEPKATRRRGEVAPLELLSLSHRTEAGDFV